ncbi:MAG: hypothetical protein AAFV25_22220, partial [Bacteroidota bacterium]
RAPRPPPREPLSPPAGRALPAEGAAVRYELSLKAHRGNSRICFSDLNDDGEIDRETEMLQENHYYPFGMAMEGLPLDGSTIRNGKLRKL